MENMMIDLTNETTVTDENIDDIRESIPSDMAAEIEPGCTVWQRGAYNEEGRTLLRFPSGRGAWCWGGNSVWGDWDSSGNLLFDDGGSVDADGNEIAEEDETNDTETLHLYNENCAMAGQICQDAGLIERESDDIHAVTGTQAELIEHARQLVEATGTYDRKCGRSILEWFGESAEQDAEKHITLWLDETSGPGNPGWIVSEDTDDTTNTIAVFPRAEKAEAVKRAKAEATRRGLRLVAE